MDIFEYLPQLIVAYDGNDEFANLIHVKKADKDNNYYCPCCGGSVKPRALDSSKEQSHYYHITGKCTKESQLHFFCKNWLFETGSKFYINEELFEVVSIDIEKTYSTPFGDYKPDITVHTSCGMTIFFEMFFSNRKTGDDYFCKWSALGNDVVEVNIKEYMFKTEEDIIPRFTYLYHEGVCYSKTYEKKDLYATTIAKIKRELTRQKVLNYKARIEKLDWFWQEIRNGETKESILEVIQSMDYEDMVSCYSIIKRKQCVSYLKNDVLNMINQKVISDVRNSLGLPYDENVYFDLKHIRGRTYEAGIRLSVKTNHIIYDDFYLHCYKFGSNFDRISGYPKIVFSKNVHSKEEICIEQREVDKLKHIFEKTIIYKRKIFDTEKKLADFEKNEYKVRVNNNCYTVLAKIHNNNFELVFENYYMEEFNITTLSDEIQYKIKEIRDREYLDKLLNDKRYILSLSELQNYKNMRCQVIIMYEKNPQQPKKSGIHFKLYMCSICIFDKILQSNPDDFILKINECKKKIDNYTKKYAILFNFVEKINECKNNFWKATFLLNCYGIPEIEIDIKNRPSECGTIFEIAEFDNFNSLTEKDVIDILVKKMKLVMKNMELYGYRAMEVCD